MSCLRSELAALGLEPAQMLGDSTDCTLADGNWVLVNRGNYDLKEEGGFAAGAVARGWGAEPDQ